MNFFKSILSDEDPQPQNPENSSPRAAASTSDTTRSESVLETYRRDLAEFGSGLRKEFDLFREVANNVVKDLPASIDGVIKGIIIPEPSKNSKLGNYNRFDSQLHSIQNDIRTYIDDPTEDGDEFDKWKLGFVLGEKRGEIAEVLKNEKVDAIYREVVVVGGGEGEVDEVSFWCVKM